MHLNEFRLIITHLNKNKSLKMHFQFLSRFCIKMWIKISNYFPGNKLKNISHLIYQQIDKQSVQKNISWEIKLNQFKSK